MDAMSGKRVLIVVENLPVPLDRRVWQEACALRDAGYVVTIVCPKMRGYTATEEFIDGIQIYRHWISSEASGGRGFLLEYTSALVGELWCAMKAWRRGGFDIIHLCNPPDLLFLVALPFKLLFGTKVVYDVHDLWPEMFVAKFRRRGLLRQGVLYWGVLLAHRCTLAVADCVIATNESVKHMVLKRGQLSDDVVSVVRTSPVAIDTTVEADPDLKGGKPYLVVYVGVMGDADGVRHLIEAADHLVNEMNRDDVTFLLMGTGPEYRKLVALRDQKQLGNCVDIPGMVSDEFLSVALQTADLGVSCDPINEYNHHCTMNKVLEYMAFGKPQVMFDLREGRVSAGDAAVYIEESSVLLAESIANLLDDPVLRQKLGRLGLERIDGELGWKQSVEALIGLYAKISKAP